MIRRHPTAHMLAAALCVGLGAVCAPGAVSDAAAQAQAAKPIQPSSGGSGMLFGAAGNGVEVAETEEFTAMVLTVDAESRQILLRNLDTGEVSVRAPDAEAGQINVKPGDLIKGMVTRGISARPAEAGDEEATTVETISLPAAMGGQAALVSGRLTRSVVVLEAWNPVSFVMVALTPEGRTLRNFVPSPEAQEFLASQEPGAKIQIEISETAVLTRIE